MVEGDFGINLPVKILCESGTIESDDQISFVIKSHTGDKVLIEKTFTNIEDNKFDLMFTEEESKLLVAGNYNYNIDWFKSGKFMNNIIKNETFRVDDK
jgi:hypothetical protein